jgi:carbamate kinase
MAPTKTQASHLTRRDAVHSGRIAIGDGGGGVPAVGCGQARYSEHRGHEAIVLQGTAAVARQSGCEGRLTSARAAIVWDSPESRCIPFA